MMTDLNWNPPMKLVREVAFSEVQSCMKEAQVLEQNPASKLGQKKA